MAAAVPAVLAGALAVALSARVSVAVPGSPVPQSLQTLGVVVVGGVLGWRRGVASLLVYLLMGLAGLPVFADGAAGAARLVGPTAGYLWGFVVGAGMAGWWGRTVLTGGGVTAWPGGGVARWVVGAGWLALGFAGAHGLILGAGWLRLAAVTGPGGAWLEGVRPFLWGGVVKSILGAVLLVGWWRWRLGAGTGLSEPPELAGGRDGPARSGTG